MQPSYECEVRAEGIAHRGWQHRRPVLLPFAAPDVDLMAVEIDVFDPTDVGDLGTPAVVPGADRRAHAVEQLRLGDVGQNTGWS